MAAIRILLTFDDGPHAAADAHNRTAKALGRLAVNGYVAVFFVQTRAVNGNTPMRMSNPQGGKWTKNAHVAKHLIQIHTGSRKDHEFHTVRAKAKPEILNDGIAGANGLETDLRRAMKAIKALTGEEPKYVRSTYLARNQKVNDTYATLNLKHIGAHVVSGDADPWTAREKKLGKIARLKHRRDVVCQQLEERIRAAVVGGAKDLVVLFHELHPATAEYLPEFLHVIEAIAMAGNTFAIVSDPAIAHEILENTNV